MKHPQESWRSYKGRIRRWFAVQIAQIVRPGKLRQDGRPDLSRKKTADALEDTLVKSGLTHGNLRWLHQALKRKDVQGPKVDGVLTRLCSCWHASNRGPGGETLEHPDGFHCDKCKDSGVLKITPLCFESEAATSAFLSDFMDQARDYFGPEAALDLLRQALEPTTCVVIFGCGHTPDDCQCESEG